MACMKHLIAVNPNGVVAGEITCGKKNSAMQTPGYYRTECDRIAFFYDFLVQLITLPFGGEKRLRETSAALLNPQPGDKILDVCCGTGELTRIISEKIGEMGEVIGIDLSPRMLCIARRKVRRAYFIHTTSENIPYPANYFKKNFALGKIFVPNQKV